LFTSRARCESEPVCVRGALFEVPVGCAALVPLTVFARVDEVAVALAAVLARELVVPAPGRAARRILVVTSASA